MTIGWGAIGCGDVLTRKSGPPLAQVPGCRLVAVTRRDRSAGEAFARRFSCRYHPDAATLLADREVTAVYVATQPDSHCAYTLLAADAGRPVLVEKEMARDAGECTRMIETCRHAGVALAVAFYRRCYPSVLRARDLLRVGAIGRLQRLAINDEFPLSHRLDLIHFLAGPQAALAQRDDDLQPGSHATQGRILTLTAASGAVSTLNVGWSERTLVETITLEGERGTIRIDDLKAGKLRVERDGRSETESVGGLPWTHWGLVEDFVRHLATGTPLACDGAEGRRSQVIEDLVKRLPADGREQRVDYGDA